MGGKRVVAADWGGLAGWLGVCVVFASEVERLKEALALKERLISVSELAGGRQAGRQADPLLRAAAGLLAGWLARSGGWGGRLAAALVGRLTQSRVGPGLLPHHQDLRAGWEGEVEKERARWLAEREDTDSLLANLKTRLAQVGG